MSKAIDKSPFLNVLIADDDEDMRDLLAAVILSRGHKVTVAEDGASALRHYEETRHDLLIIDWLMPTLDGLQLCRAIRDEPNGERPVIIMMTGQTASEHLQEAIAAGADDYIHKPISGTLLEIRLAVAERIVRNRQERMQAVNALRASEERYALATRGANDGIWDWDLQTQEIFCSERLMAILNIDGDHEIINPEIWRSHIHPDDIELVEQAIREHIKGTTDNIAVEYRIVREDGGYRWVLARGLTVRDNKGWAYRMAGSLTDITVRKLRDALTGLPNRALLMDRIDSAIARVRRNEDDVFAVLIVGIDGFKNLNHALGHNAGDRLLTQVAKRLQTLVGPNTTLAYLGGDEFSVILEEVASLPRLVRQVQAIKASFDDPFILGVQPIVLSAGIGVTTSRVEHETAGDFLRAADVAMRRAKRAGRGQYEIFDADMGRQAQQHLHMEMDLRRAVERSELQVYYQPIVQLDSRKLVGFEALLRWKHPLKGYVSPDEFIPLAENTNLIDEIGGFVLREAARQLRLWKNAIPGTQDLSVAINLSVKQLANARLCEDVAEVLEEFVLPPEALKIEITESILMQTGESGRELLDQLIEVGVGIAIDDFGTGYSSLSYLYRLAASFLKIDKTFINDLETDPKARAIVEAVILLGRSLGLQVVAEGVETWEQVNILENLQCDFGQGYCFAEPLPASEAERLIGFHFAVKNSQPPIVNAQEPEDAQESPSAVPQA